jgi:chromosome segregation ATPase
VYLQHELDKQGQQFTQQANKLQHELQKSSETLADERHSHKLQLDEVKRSAHTAQALANEYKCKYEQLQSQLAAKDRDLVNSTVHVNLQQSNGELQQQVNALQQAEQEAEQSLQTSRKHAATLATTLQRYVDT